MCVYHSTRSWCELVVILSGSFAPQGDLRRMWSEPFHAKSSSSRFLEVWCCSDQHKFPSSLPPAHQTEKERAKEREGEVSEERNCTRLLIIPHSRCHPPASGWTAARGLHCQMDSCAPTILSLSLFPLPLFFLSSIPTSSHHLSLSVSLFSPCSTELSRILPDRSSSGREPEPLWAPSVFPFVPFGAVTDLQTEISLFTALWTRNVDSATARDDDDPIRDQHTVEDSVVISPSFPRSLFPFLIKPNPHPSRFPFLTTLPSQKHVFYLERFYSWHIQKWCIINCGGVQLYVYMCTHVLGVIMLRCECAWDRVCVCTNGRKWIVTANGFHFLTFRSPNTHISFPFAHFFHKTHCSGSFNSLAFEHKGWCDFAFLYECMLLPPRLWMDHWRWALPG